jgi:hypothetical protein
MVKLRRKRGSGIAFSAVLALVLIVLGVGFFFFSMYLGAANETKNATDAGALNVGKQVLSDTKVCVVIAGDPKEEFFRDVTDPTPVPGVGNGIVDLTNIDRIWAKALFVAINADAAGGASGDAAQNVSDAQAGAQSLSDKLAAKLTDENNLHTYFEDYSKQNSTRMIGVGTTVVANPGPDRWQTSMMDPNKESNIEVTGNLPIGYSLPGGYSIPTQRVPIPSGAAGKKYLKGYFPLTVANNTFWQVPYLFDQKPHLVSQTLFDVDKTVSGWDKAVPNAFSVGGKVATKPGVTGESATSWVQTNPRKQFPLQFPNGFVRVILKPNDLQWWLDFVPMDQTTYEPFPETEKESGDGIPYPIPFICETVSATAHVGNEYVPPTLLTAMCGPSQGGKPFDYIYQRCQEMLPDCTTSDVKLALTACIPSNDTSEQTFYIYPVAGHIIATSDAMTIALPLGCSKDGTAEMSQEWSDSTPGVGNYLIEDWTCDGVPGVEFVLPIVTVINRSWTPGTGYSKGCLGELTVHHNSDAVTTAMPCTCPPV